ncbi:MAG: TonB-dependent receptor plug domain-containing protein, partial [Caldimicrobium sp.]
GNFIPDASYPMKDIGRIEVTFGPSSSIYGTNALTGVIYVEREPSHPFSASMEVGEYEEKGFDVSIYQKNFYGLLHYKDIPGENYKGTPINPRKDNFGFILKGKTLDTPLQLFYFKNQYNTPYSQRGLPLASEDKEPYGSKEEVEFFSLGFKKVLPFERFTLYLQPSFTYFEANTPQVRIPHSAGNFTALDIELENQRFNLLSYAEIPLKIGQFLVGFDISQIYHKKYLSKLYNGTESVYSLPKEREFNYAFFAQYKRLLGKVQLHFGIRYDHFELWGERFSPRLSLTYFLSPEASLQLNYSEAFNAPPLFYAKANPVLGYGSASGLKPEVLKNYSLNFFYQKLPITLRITPFINVLKDKIGYDAVNRVYTNLPKTKTGGLEFESIYKNNSFLAFLNYTYLAVVDGKDAPNVYKNEYIYGIPKGMLKGGVSFNVPGIPGFSISPSFKWYSRAFWRSEKIDSYIIWDLNILYDKARYNLNFKIENLFDKHYKRAGILPPTVWEGRVIKAGIEVKY